MEEDIVNMST